MREGAVVSNANANGFLLKIDSSRKVEGDKSVHTPHQLLLVLFLQLFPHTSLLLKQLHLLSGIGNVAHDGLIKLSLVVVRLLPPGMGIDSYSAGHLLAVAPHDDSLIQRCISHHLLILQGHIARDSQVNNAVLEIFESPYI